MDPINEAYENAVNPKQIDEAKTDQIMKSLEKTLRFAIADRKEYDGRETNMMTGKTTIVYQWQRDLGDAKINHLHDAIDAYQEYLNAKEEWSKLGSV